MNNYTSLRPDVLVVLEPPAGIEPTSQHYKCRASPFMLRRHNPAILPKSKQRVNVVLAQTQKKVLPPRASFLLLFAAFEFTSECLEECGGKEDACVLLDFVLVVDPLVFFDWFIEDAPHVLSEFFDEVLLVGGLP